MLSAFRRISWSSLPHPPEHEVIAMLDSTLSALSILSLLSDCGVRDVCIAPGSRNAPFALLRERFPLLRYHVHFDERDLGFLALGMALGLLRPVAVITTSGTAAGNLLPAVMEARNSHIPLILITADRPWELLDTGANQTCEQDRIYGSYARFVHVPVLSSAGAVSAARQKIINALSEALLSGMPLHLNVELREPLYEDLQEADACPDALPADVQRACFPDAEVPLFPDQSPLPDIFPGAPLAAKIREFFRGDGQTLVAAGTIHPRDAARLTDVLNCCGGPVIADIQSNLRGRMPVLAPFDILTARIPELCERLRKFPRMAVIEGRFISKKLLNFIRSFPGEVIFITAYGDGINASGRPGLTIRITLSALLQLLPEVPAGDPPGATLADLTPEIAAVKKETAACSSLDAELTEVSAAAGLSRLSTPLLIGNSLPARLADTLILPEHPKPVYSLRGVSGIDGLIAAAAGLSLGDPDSGITAVIGDMSALYGLTGMALLKRYRVRIVIFNNNGGNIFLKFPIASTAIRNDLFVNPQNADFSHAAAMFGIPWRRPQTQQEFLKILEEPVSGGEIVEIHFPQGEGLDLLRKLTAPGEA